MILVLLFGLLCGSAKDDEQVAAALGYTVHLLLLASKYLEVSTRGLRMLILKEYCWCICHQYSGGGRVLRIRR